MTRPSNRLTAVALSAALLLAACSSGGGAEVSEEEKPYAEAIARSMIEDEESVEVDEGQAECMGASLVNIIGVDELEAADIAPEDLANDDDDLLGAFEMSEEQAEKTYDAFGDCGIDLRQMIMADAFDDDDMNEEQAKCLDEVLDDGMLREVMILAMTGGDEESPEAMAIMAPLMTCAFMGMDEGDFDFDDEDLDFEDGDFDFGD